MLRESLLTVALAAAPALAGLPISPSTDHKVNVYWGQKGSTRLRDYCDKSSFDYVTIGFINNSPENDPSKLKYPGSNFAAHCAADTYVDDKDTPSLLLSKCNFIAEDIPYCQSKGKKVLLSIGGAAGNYVVSSKKNGEYFADFMYNAFGPFNKRSSAPRPFDYEENGVVKHVVVDGFDFDIERKEAVEDSDGYSAMVKQLNKINDAKLLITAAPECPLSTEFFKMKKIIDAAKFDILFIQFYNNPSCDGNSPAFAANYAAWETYLATTPSKKAKIFLGLPGDSTEQSAGSGYMKPSDACSLVKNLKSKTSFGGVMLWDMVTADENELSDGSYLDIMYKCVHGSSSTTSSASSVASTSSTTAWSSSSSSSVSSTSSSSSASSTSSSSSASSTWSSSSASSTSSSSSASSTWSSSSSSSASSTSSSSSASSTWSSSSTLSTTSATLSSSTTSATSTSTDDDDYCWEEPTETAHTRTRTPTGRPSTTRRPHVTYVTMTTSVVYTESCETITPTTRGGRTRVVTHTVAVSTTVCPVTITADEEPTASAAWPAGWTTSTVYSTKTYTITSCAPTVTNCPGKLPWVTTEVIPVSTTVCPISDAQPRPTGNWHNGDNQFTTLTAPKPGGWSPTAGSVPVQSQPAGKPSGWAPTDGKPAGDSESWPKAGAPAPTGSRPAGTVTGALPVVTAGAARNSMAFGLAGVAAMLFLAL